jgi:hypothetical protein
MWGHLLGMFMLYDHLCVALDFLSYRLCIIIFQYFLLNYALVKVVMAYTTVVCLSNVS